MSNVEQAYIAMCVLLYPHQKPGEEEVACLARLLRAPQQQAESSLPQAAVVAMQERYKAEIEGHKAEHDISDALLADAKDEIASLKGALEATYAKLRSVNETGWDAVMGQQTEIEELRSTLKDDYCHAQNLGGGIWKCDRKSAPSTQPKGSSK